jgi:hypothetical protein
MKKLILLAVIVFSQNVLAEYCTVKCTHTQVQVLDRKDNLQGAAVEDFRVYCLSMGGRVEPGVPPYCYGPYNWYCVKGVVMQEEGTAFGQNLYEARQNARHACQLKVPPVRERECDLYLPSRGSYYEGEMRCQ